MEKTIKYLENGEYHYATVRSVGDLAQLKTDSKETLVEAINELWNGGGNADPSKAPKPEGYDQLVQDVADAVKNQQEISQQWIEWQNEEAQLTEERKQAYLQAMKEMQEAIDKAKADAAALDDKTAKLDEQITKTFSDLDTSIQNMHEQLQKEADRMNQELIDTKSDLTKVRTDLQNAQLDNGKIHDELTNINGKFEHKVWQTDLDPLKEQIDRAETSVQQTKDELLGKASRQDLDTVTNTVSKLDTQLKETAKGVEISVKKDELGGEIAEALTNKTNILLGTRRFTTNKWTQRDHVEICSDPWKGFLVAKQNSPIEGIQQAYDVKAGTTYTFSLFAKMDTLDDSNKPQITLAQNNLDTSLDTKIDVWRKDIDDITSDFKRYDLTFTPSEDCTIYPHVISNSNNPIFVCGYQLEIGKELTPWEPNQEDVGDYVEKSEAQFNVYNNKIQALTEKQRQQGDTQEKLRTEVTQTAEGVKQVSESLKDTNGDITKLRGDLERTADHMKSEYESYTNKAVGQISDSTLNLIRNSSFQNKDEDFAQWQNISAKANIRQDENGLRWVELTQSGLTTDNPQGITSNYFNVKQGKVTVAVDVKSGDKATLDNESVLFLELYNDAKKRVDFRFITLNELGLSKNLLDDHKVHRGLYRLGIDRNDAKYMTVKAHLMRNGDLYFTNFSARLSSIDDGAYEPNPDDINQQILKQNTKIEQNAKEVAIKANSVDVTRDIKSAVDGIQVGGRNLAAGTNQEYTMGYGIPNTTWKDGFASVTLPTTGSGIEILPQYPHTFSYELTPEQEYTQTIWFRTDATAKDLKAAVITWFTSDCHDYQSATIQRIGPNSYKMFSSYKWPGKQHNGVRLFDIIEFRQAFDLNTGTYLKFGKLKLEEGNKSTSWSPAPEDTSAEIKSAKDAAIQVASEQINIHVNELTTSFDDKLNKRVNEVKTASEKFTSDGIEQTVTKITNVKNDVDRLGDNLRNTGTRNLLHNTSDQYRTLTNDGAWLQKTTASNTLTSVANYHGGDEFTYAATVTNTSNQPVLLEFQNCDQDRRWLTGKYSLPVPAGAKDYRISVSFPITADTRFILAWLIFQGGKGAPGEKIQVKDERLVLGVVPGSWSPNPDDINQQITNTNKKIDTQTLDSANIDNMRTQGHYFVRNLTGNPIGGWVYVDVTGNNNDRIRQDVYQDNGSKHMYRRGLNGTWSDWEQGAYLSDVNNVKTEVTASVKNLGDRVTTEVNSVTSKVDNMKMGGRNLLKGTRDFNSKYWYQSGDHTALADNPTDSSVKEIHSWLDWHSYKNNQVIQLDPSKDYMVSADIAIYNGNGEGLYVTAYGTLDGTGTALTNDVNLTGFPKSQNNEGFRRVYLPLKKRGRKLETFRIEGHGNWSAGSGSVFISKIMLYEGNTPLAWSDSSDDFVEAIKEVNTKWDVANGQIQGKVTATDVNNIINGKGYATQSWAQTMFQMKSDSITLQAVRDNITNGIQNQVNDQGTQINNANTKINETTNRLNNMKIGGTNLLKGTSDVPRRLQGSGYLCKTTANDIYTPVSGYHTGDQFTYSATITNNSNRSVSLEMWLFKDKGHGPINVNSHSQVVPPHAQNQRVSATIEITSETYWIRTYVIYSDGKGTNDESVDVSNEKLEYGNVATAWSLNPNDSGNGVNLLRGTADFSWPTGIGIYGTVNLSYERFDDTTITLHISGSQGGGIYTKWGDAFPDGQIQIGEQYTFSFDIKGSGTFRSVKNEGESLNLANGVTISNSYERVKVVGTIKELNKAFIIYFNGAFDAWIKNVKIERGAIATPWTPHPFDDKDKGVNLLKSTAYWNPADWNHISNNVWYDDNWVDSNGHKAYGHHTAWQGLGQTVYVTPGVYTWSAQIYLNGLDSNDSVYPYMGDSQYNGTVQVQYIRRPMLGVNDQNKWINYSATFYVKNAGNLCVRPELNRDHGNIHVGSQKLEHGMVATPWSPSPYDSDPKNVISAINITPDQIKIASNKIVIDGNTDIHGDLRTDRVRLVGKQGLIDMTGDDGMRMANKNGSSILIGNGNIDLMYNNDFRMNLDSSMMTLLKKESALGQNNPIAIGSIGTSFYANDKRRGMQILYTPGKDDWTYRGADYLGLGYSLDNEGQQGQRKIYDQLELYRQDTTINGHVKKKGIHFQDNIHLSNGQQIYLENKDNNIQDPIKLIGTKYPASAQAEYNQPYLTLGYSNNMGNAGLGINWWELIPTGRINSSYSYMSAHGTDGEDGLTVSWYSWPGWYGGRKAPSIVYKGKDGSLKNGGFVFYPGGEVCFWQGDFRSNFRWSGIKQTD